jgi:hypothetical protein
MNFMSSSENFNRYQDANEVLSVVAHETAKITIIYSLDCLTMRDKVIVSFNTMRYDFHNLYLHHESYIIYLAYKKRPIHFH